MDPVVIENGRKIQMFICNHHHSQAIYCRQAKMELLKHVDTRFASCFILLRRLVEIMGDLVTTVVPDMWEQWRQSTSDATMEINVRFLTLS